MSSLLPLSTKRQGKDPNEKKMPKPEIAPYRDESRTHRQLYLAERNTASVVTPIEPVFLKKLFQGYPN